MDYRFVNKDPVIDIIRTEMQRYGNLTPAQIAKVAHGAGCSPTTLHNWLFGDTRRPTGIIVRFVMEELRLTLQYVREDGSKVRQPQIEMISQKDQEAILKADRDRERERERKKKERTKKK